MKDSTELLLLNENKRAITQTGGDIHYLANGCVDIIFPDEMSYLMYRDYQLDLQLKAKQWTLNNH